MSEASCIGRWLTSEAQHSLHQPFRTVAPVGHLNRSIALQESVTKCIAILFVGCCLCHYGCSLAQGSAGARCASSRAAVSNDCC